MKSIILRTIKYLSVLVLFLGILGIAKISASAAELNMHVINIGHGDGILLESAGHYMLVDSGETSGKKTLMAYLEKNIVGDTIDYVVATHADKDHISGFPAVFDKYVIKQLIYGEPMKPLINSETGKESNFGKFVDAINTEEGLVHGNSFRGQTFSFGDANVEVIYDGRLGTTYNESSIVMRITCGNKSILMTGDLPTTMETKLMKLGYNFKANILKVGHHGAGASTSNEFIEHVNPTHAVIPNGTTDDGVYFPKDSVLQRLALHFVKTYLATEGDIVMNIKNNVISTTHVENKKFECISRGQITIKQKKYYAPSTVGKEVIPKFSVYANGQLISSSQYDVKLSDNTHTGVATLTVTGNKKKYVGSIETTFNILPRKEKIYIARRSRSRKKVFLQWSKQSYASGYEIKYSTDKKLKKKVKTIFVKGGTKNTKTIKKLNKKKKYYFKIRAYTKNIGNGKWSAKKKVK